VESLRCCGASARWSPFVLNQETKISLLVFLGENLNDICLGWAGYDGSHATLMCDARAMIPDGLPVELPRLGKNPRKAPKFRNAQGTQPS
jgi:hypothetical protein